MKYINLLQELPQEIGEALCELLDGRDDVEINLTRFHFLLSFLIKFKI